MLGQGLYGEWLIIHGHKHHPKLSYAAGGQSAPIVFSAGSLCAQLYAELGTLARNQFYLIDLPHALYGRYGFVGTFQAWDWNTGLGWRRANPSGSGLPGYGGFGFRGNLQLIAAQTATEVSTGAVDWNALRQKIPQLDFLLPSDLGTLLQILERQHNIKAMSDTEGRLRQIGVTL
jgi:hypothetical protein